MSLREGTVNENLISGTTQNCMMANVEGPVSVLGFGVLFTDPSAEPIPGVGFLCKSDDPQRHQCLEDNMPNPICAICHKPVTLEASKTNELGKAVHERCYSLGVRSKKATSPRKA
jgi:hypothetical protein